MHLSELDATAQAQLVASGEASPLELVEAAIDRIERLNPELNAVIHPRFEKACAEAKGDLPAGPFRGVPMLVKDLWPSMAGEPHYMGVRLLQEVDRRPDFDSHIIQRYQAAGFVIVGRTNTPEMGASASTEPLLYGPTRNPWSTDHSPGGSSGGSASAVASGMVPIANGSDGGGSLRIPASACGLVGLKPSRGRISMGPGQDEWGLSVQHALTTSMRDCAAMLDVSAGPVAGDGVIAPEPSRPYVEELGTELPRLKIGVMTELPGYELDEDVLDAVYFAKGLLDLWGHDVQIAQPEALEMLPEMGRHVAAVFSAGTAHALDSFAAEFGVELAERHVEAGTWMMLKMGREALASEWLETAAAQHRFRRGMAQWWESDFDLLLTPTTAAVTPPIGELVCSDEGPLDALMKSGPYAAFTSMFNVTGQPAISLPLHITDEGLPVGVQLVGAYGAEDLLIAVGSEFERVTEWGLRRPGLHASTL